MKKDTELLKAQIVLPNISVVDVEVSSQGKKKHQVMVSPEAAKVRNVMKEKILSRNKNKKVPAGATPIYLKPRKSDNVSISGLLQQQQSYAQLAKESEYSLSNIPHKNPQKKHMRVSVSTAALILPSVIDNDIRSSEINLIEASKPATKPRKLFNRAP